MVIYGEFLFLENAVTGAVILLLTGKLCGSRRSAAAITSGSIMCGIYAFVLLVPVGAAVAVGGKLLFSAAVVAAVFRPSTKKSFLRVWAVFYIISFLMGGITVALMYMTGAAGAAGGGSFYFREVTYLQIVSGVLVTMVAGTWLGGYLHEKVQREAVVADVTVEIGEKSWQLKGLVDTGNSLKDPVSGYPVSVITEAFAEEIRAGQGDELERRVRLIPYKSVGNCGMLWGIRPDRITVGGRDAGKMILAAAGTGFGRWKGDEKIEILLNGQCFDGRILNDK